LTPISCGKLIQPKYPSENCAAKCYGLTMIISPAKLPISTPLRVSDIVPSQLSSRELIGHGRHPNGQKAIIIIKLVTVLPGPESSELGRQTKICRAWWTGEHVCSAPCFWTMKIWETRRITRRNKKKKSTNSANGGDPSRTGFTGILIPVETGDGELIHTVCNTACVPQYQRRI
jgi:hypothetical protein